MSLQPVLADRQVDPVARHNPILSIPLRSTPTGVMQIASSEAMLAARITRWLYRPGSSITCHGDGHLVEYGLIAGLLGLAGNKLEQFRILKFL